MPIFSFEFLNEIAKGDGFEPRHSRQFFLPQQVVILLVVAFFSVKICSPHLAKNSQSLTRFRAFSGRRVSALRGKKEQRAR